MIVYKTAVPGSQQRMDKWEFKGKVKCDTYDDIKDEIEYIVDRGPSKGFEYTDTNYGDSTSNPDIESIVAPLSGEVRLHFSQVLQKPESKHDWSKVYFDIVVENELWVASYFDQRIINDESLDNVIRQIKDLLQFEPEILSVGGFYIDWNPNPKEDKTQQVLRFSKRKIDNAKI